MLGLSQESSVQLADCRTEEYSDDFYDFGLDDYASVVQGYKAAKQRAEAGLKTAKMREQEQLALAARFPHTRIRVFLPDGFVLQVRLQCIVRSLEKALLCRSGLPVS